MKVAILVAPARYWRWQRLLADRLGARHAVSVFACGDAGGVPPLMRALLAMERRVFKAPADVALEPAPAEATTLEGFDLVIDLSGGPARPGALRLLYDGEADEAFLWGRLLRKQPPMIAVARDGETLAASYAAIEDDLVLARGLRFAFARAALLIERAVEIVEGVRHKAPLPDPAPHVPQPYKDALIAPFAFARVVAGARALSRKRGHWVTAWRRGGGPFAIASADGAFVADPFVVSRGGEDFLFAEALVDGGPKGHIVVARLPAQTQSVLFEHVLTEAHHLSYPHVFEHDGEMFMMPETAQAGKLSIYRAVDFPTRWEKHCDVIDDARVVDATIVQRADRFYLFCTLVPPNGSSWDELSIFHGPSVFGPWTPHALNPVKSDVRGSRMGGRFRIIRDRLLRPAQDCSTGYGAKLAWYEVTTLTPDTCTERRIGEWDPKVFGDFTGLHTYDAHGDIEVLDIKMDRPRRALPQPLIVGGDEIRVPDAH